MKRTEVRDTLYLLGFLVVAGLLLIIGRHQLPPSTVLTWTLTFGATAGVGVLIISLYRVQQELKQTRFELARKDVELQIAREVQAALFPRTLPSNRGLSISAICIPAQGISGDYYDIVECPDGRLVVAIADISGKGLSAAILMSNIQARFRALIEMNDSLSEVCRLLSDHLNDFTEPERFATLFVAQWRPGSSRLEYVNAGHQVPVVVGGPDPELRLGGPPLGLFPGQSFKCGTAELAEGAVMVLYSDGITEATDSREEDFGTERLQSLIERHAGDSVRDLQRAVLDSVSDWTRREPQDDMTLVIIRVDDKGRLSGRDE
ncbi:MAG: PP2C family protein-serine/threonine phosphatase [Acidobacteriota bacterium]